jgi:hypothetical protein
MRILLRLLVVLVAATVIVLVVLGLGGVVTNFVHTGPSNGTGTPLT